MNPYHIATERRAVWKYYFELVASNRLVMRKNTINWIDLT
jgi:hypothetical protein